MKKVTIRVPATTANLGPGFDSFGCALCLYTDVTLELADAGFCITGCDAAYAGEDNLVFVAYKAVLAALEIPLAGVHIHINAHIPISRGLGSSAALLAAGAMGANALHGSPLSKQALLEIITPIEGHPDNLAPALFGGLTVSMMEQGRPITVPFALHGNWIFLAMIPDFSLSTSLARQALLSQYSRADAVYNISHGALTLKALETADEALLRLALRDRIHQRYRSGLIRDYDAVRDLVEGLGGAFCISGAGPTLLCLTCSKEVCDAICGQLPQGWRALPLRADRVGAYILDE